MAHRHPLNLRSYFLYPALLFALSIPSASAARDLTYLDRVKEFDAIVAVCDKVVMWDCRIQDPAAGATVTIEGARAVRRLLETIALDREVSDEVVRDSCFCLGQVEFVMFADNRCIGTVRVYHFDHAVVTIDGRRWVLELDKKSADKMLKYIDVLFEPEEAPVKE